MATPTKPWSRFQLDLARYELRLHDHPVRLERQPMELLLLLVERQGELVTREEIAARLWSKQIFVEVDQSINRAIRKLRRALRDDPERPQFIETVIGKGYRFIGPIEVLARPEAQPHTLPPPAISTAPQHGVTFALILVVLAIAALAVWFSWRASGHGNIRSLAVLPLRNVSGDPAQDYLADALTESLITDVAKASGLRVISHTTVLHYSGSQKTLPDIARELHVDAVVEGSVSRLDDRVRITAQLIEAPSDRHLWADTYQRRTTDLLGLQDDVAREIARQLKTHLAGAQPATRQPQDAEAQDAYLKGVHQVDTFSREGLQQGLEYFQQAVQREPQFAEAWAGLARAYGLMALFHYGPRGALQSNAEAAAHRALQLDDRLSDAHAALAGSLLGRRSWAAAEQELRSSIRLNPSDAVAHQLLGYLLAGVLRRFDEGVSEMRLALDLDPLSPSKRNSLGAALYWARRDDEALAVFKDIPDGDANTERRHRRMANIYDRKGMQVESISELVQTLQLTGRRPLADAVQRAYHSSGYQSARKTFFAGDLREREPRARGRDPSPDELWVAIDCAQLGDADHAFQWLERASADGEEGLMYLQVETYWDPIRPDPRFRSLVDRLNLH